MWSLVFPLIASVVILAVIIPAYILIVSAITFISDYTNRRKNKEK